MTDFEEKTLTKRGADTLRQKVRDIVEKDAQSVMDKCWALYETDRTLVKIGGKLIPIWEAWDYKDWNEMVGKEFGMYPTTAYAYILVWETFYIDLAGAWDANNLQGITKMRILCSAGLTKKNVNRWLKKAGKMTCRKLRAEVFGTEEIRHFSASVTDREFETVKKALEVGKEAFGENIPRGELLATILDEWTKQVQVSKKIRKAS